MKVLVTGAGGFIGSHLVDKLLRDGHTVIGVCRSEKDVSENLDFNVRYKRRLSLYKADIGIPDELNTIPFSGVDWVFHLAAKIGNAVSKLHPQDYHAVNVDGTVHVLECARRASVKRFIYASTASVYGIPEKYPTPEHSDIRLDYPYSVSKYIGEQYCLHYYTVYSLPVVILRLFNVYGSKNRPSGHYGPTLSIFLEQKRNNTPLTIRGNGKQRRDFTNIDDIYTVFYDIASSSVSGEIFNVGSGVAYSMNDVASLISDSISYVPFTDKEPHLTLADITKIKTYTGWKPRVTLSEGIKKLL